MQCFRLLGGTPLAGTVMAAGSKNATLPLLAASLLVGGETVFVRSPKLSDVRFMLGLLQSLGMSIERFNDDLKLKSPDFLGTEADYDMVRRMRGSVCVMGPLLARFGRARMPLPGGCVIGSRPIDIHLKGFATLGASIEVNHGIVDVTAPPGGLKGTVVDLSGPYGSTVLGTINVMLAALGAHGCTRIQGAAREPEVQSVGNYLLQCGAHISGLGTSSIEIEGDAVLRGGRFEIPADRIEVGTLLLAAAITRGSITITSCLPEEQSFLLNCLRATGVSVDCLETSIVVRADTHRLTAIDLSTGPFPGFPTDLQAQWLAFSTQCCGRTRVTETVYPERFLHVAELNRMGASISVSSGCAVLDGKTTLSGAPVMASDLRASAALVLAGLAAEGETVIRRVYHLDRGYEGLEVKIQALGGAVQREEDDMPA